MLELTSVKLLQGILLTDKNPSHKDTIISISRIFAKLSEIGKS